MSNQINVMIQKGIALYRSGKLQSAAGAFREVLSRDPRNFDALQLLGVIVFEQGQAREGERLIRKALRQNPKVPHLHFNLGNMQRAQRKPADALASYRQALKLDPNNEWILNNLGAVCAEMGRLDEAFGFYKKGVEVNPNNPSLLSNFGQALWRVGRNQEALAALQKAVAVAPGHVDALTHLGGLYLTLGKNSEAESSLRQALKIDPDNLHALNNLAAVHMAAGDSEEALTLVQRVVELNPHSAEAFANLATAQVNLGKPESALAAYEQALKINPDYLAAISGLVKLLFAEGRKEEAEGFIRRGLRINPGDAKLLFAKTEVISGAAIDDHIQEMERWFKADNFPANDRIILAFGLAKIFEQVKDYDGAFDYLAAANRLKRATYDYKLEEDGKFFGLTKSVFNSGYFQEHEASGISDRTPIFIVGMPRSGTTLIEQILASHSQVFGAGELNYIARLITERCLPRDHRSYPELVSQWGRDAFEGMGRSYLDKLNARSQGAVRVTDKMPHNFLYLGLIRQLFPNAKVVHCRRHPVDNCFSIFKRNFDVLHKYAYDLQELGGYYLLYSDLMSHWHDVLPGYIFDLQYEEMVSDQAGVTRRLLEFCELEWEDGCLEFHKLERTVHTASQHQVRKEMYGDSVDFWRHYETQLQPLVDVLKKGGAL
jgi:tetratricopeptide (TPR) repeat protein